MIPFRRDSVTKKNGGYISYWYKRMHISSPRKIRDAESTEDIAFGSLEDFLLPKTKKHRTRKNK